MTANTQEQDLGIILQNIERKSIRGRREWLVWEGPQGVRVEVKSRDTLVQALKDCGRAILRNNIYEEQETNRVWHITPYGRFMLDNWWIALNILRNYRWFQ